MYTLNYFFFNFCKKNKYKNNFDRLHSTNFDLHIKYIVSFNFLILLKLFKFILIFYFGYELFSCQSSIMEIIIT